MHEHFDLGRRIIKCHWVFSQ